MKFNASLAITYLLNHPYLNLYTTKDDWYQDYICLSKNKECIEYHNVNYCYVSDEHSNDCTDYFTLYTFEEFTDKFEDKFFEEG